MNRNSNAPRKFRSAAFLMAASLVIAPLAWFPAAAAAQAQSNSGQSAAENVVRTDLQRGFDILNNRSLSDDDRRARLRDYLTSLIDIRHIALFTLGPMRSYARPVQVEQYVDAFRAYSVAAFESQLTHYSGQYLRITGSMQAGADNYIIRTVVVDPNEGSNHEGDPIEVDIRVANDNGRYVVTDLSVAGIWLALEKRDQFDAYLEDQNGNFDALIMHLNLLTERLRSGTSSARVATATQAQ